MKLPSILGNRGERDKPKGSCSSLFLCGFPQAAGDELVSALEVLPEYDASIGTADVPVRLTALSDLYRRYVPSAMSLEIYSKLYLSLLRSLQKKGTNLAVQQRYENNKAIQQKSYSRSHTVGFWVEAE